MKCFEAPASCCNHNCNQGRDSPLRTGTWLVHDYPEPPPEKPAAKAMRLASDVLMLGTRRSLGARLKRGLRNAWRYLTGAAPW
jgi:hypothetical protein